MKFGININKKHFIKQLLTCYFVTSIIFASLSMFLFAGCYNVEGKEILFPMLDGDDDSGGSIPRDTGSGDTSSDDTSSGDTSSDDNDKDTSSTDAADAEKDTADAEKDADDDILAGIVDYSDAYPQVKPDILGEISYAKLKSGRITVQGKKVPTGSLSSYSRAVEIASTLKKWIVGGKFLLTEPVAPLPGVESGVTFKPLKERPLET